jgi:hypothetical protein
MSTEVREPFPYLRSAVVLVVGALVVAGLADGARRIVARLKEASK